MDRFYSKIEKTEGCWIWKAATRGKGYGCMKIEGKVIDAHRVSYLLHKGELTPGLDVMHSCDNILCVNPDHLSLGTRKQNCEDAVSKGRMGKTIMRKLFGKKVTDDTGKIYSSIQEFCEEYGIFHSGRVGLRLSNGYKKAHNRARFLQKQ